MAASSVMLAPCLTAEADRAVRVRRTWGAYHRAGSTPVPHTPRRQNESAPHRPGRPASVPAGAVTPPAGPDLPENGPERDDHEQGGDQVEHDRGIGPQQPEADRDGVGRQAGVELGGEGPHIAFPVAPPDQMLRERVVPEDA